MKDKRQTRPKCTYCSRTLTPIGRTETSYPDWEGRKYHKKCWEMVCFIKNFEVEKGAKLYYD